MFKEVLFLILRIAPKVKCSCGHYSKRAGLLDGKKIIYTSLKSPPHYCLDCMKVLAVTCEYCGSKIYPNTKCLSPEQTTRGYCCPNCFSDGIDYEISQEYIPAV